MTKLQRNLLVLPLILVLRVVPLSIAVLGQIIYTIGCKYQNLLDKYGIHWRT